MYSPEVMTLARSMGDYLRFKPKIGTTLSELVILMTARRWTQDYEWYVHAPIAEKAGISADIIAAIRDGRRPAKMSDDETLVYDFTAELQDTRRVSDATFARARGPVRQARRRRSGGDLGLLHVPGDGAERGPLPDSRRRASRCRACPSEPAYPQLPGTGNGVVHRVWLGRARPARPPLTER